MLASDRVAFVGRTGSGKTFAARILTSKLLRLVVIDSKSTLGSWGLEDWNRRTARLLRNGHPVRARYQAPIGGDYEELFAAIYDAGNVTLYIDEAYAVMASGGGLGGRPGQWLTALYTRGRELGIGVWASTQRPTWIPLFMLSEADWVFVFRLQLMADRRRLSEIVGPAALEELDGHEVLAYHQAWPKPVRYARFAQQQEEVSRAAGAIRH